MAGTTAEKEGWERPTCCACYTPSHHLRHSIPSTSRCTRMRTFGSVMLVGLTRLCSDFCSCLSRFRTDFHLRAPENRIYLIKHRKSINFFYNYYFSKTHKSETARTKNTYKETALFVLITIHMTLQRLAVSAVLTMHSNQG